MFAASQPFLETPATQPLGLGGSEVKKARTEEKVTALPVTIRAVEKALSSRSADGEISFFGTDPGMLLFVAVVESVAKEGGSVEFTFNDSTGRMRGRHFAADAESAIDGIEVGKYVSLAGQLRTSPATHISVLSGRPVRSADEISYHMIEAAHSMLRLQRGPVEKPTATTDSLSTQPPNDNTFVASSTLAATPTTQSTPTQAPAAGALEGAALRSAAITFIRQKGDGSDEGVAIADICQHLLPASEVEIRKVLEQLVNDGDLFNTIDDDHFSVL